MAGSADSLAYRIAGGPLEAEAAVTIVAEAGEQLAALHESARVHGYVSTTRVLLDTSGAKLNILLQAAPEDGKLRLAEAHCRAPEVWSNQPITPRSDIYSLGCVLFHALAGHPPFEAPDPQTLATKHQRAAVPALRQVNPDSHSPPALERELLKALSKRPGDRHATAREFVRAIRDSMQDSHEATMMFSGQTFELLRQLQEAKQAALVAEAEAKRKTKEADAEKIKAASAVEVVRAEERRKSRLPLFLGIGIAVAAAIGTGLFFWLRDDEPQVIEKIVEKEIERTVEKTVEVMVPSEPQIIEKIVEREVEVPAEPKVIVKTKVIEKDRDRPVERKVEKKKDEGGVPVF